jgi:hypothetical protein
MSEPIVMKINGEAVTFNVTTDNHERLINEMQPSNKVGPMHNFLVRSVTQESKETLMPFLKNPTSVMILGERLIEKFVPKLEITVGE